MPDVSHAAIQWSLSVVEGVYMPQLDTLNRVLNRPLVELGPRKADARPIPYPLVTQGLSPEMPGMEPKAPKFGIQIQADLNPRYAVVFGNSVQVLESSTRDIRPFFVGFWIDARRETRFSLALNQVWLGVKRYFEYGKEEKKAAKVMGSENISPEKPRPRFYAEAGILGITGAYLATDVWLHVYAPEEGFDFYKVLTTGARGSGYASYIGAGGEYYLSPAWSLSIEGNYVVGGVKDLRWTRYFTVDPLEAGLIEVGDVATVTDFERGSRKPLFLELDGWDVKGMVRFYF